MQVTNRRLVPQIVLVQELPSPLAGEGISVLQRQRGVRGPLGKTFCNTPHPLRFVAPPREPSPARGEGKFCTTALAATSPPLLRQLPQSGRAERNLQQLDALPRQLERVLDRLCKQRAAGNGARLPCPLDAERVERRDRDGVRELHARHLERGGHEVVGERAIEQLPLSVEHEPLVERV